MRGRLVSAIRFAERLDEPSRRLEDLASSYRADVYSLDAAVTLMLDLVEQGRYESGERSEIASGLRTFVNLGEAVEAALPGLEAFRSSVHDLAPVARPVRVRARKLISTLDSIIETSRTFADWGNRANGLLELVEDSDDREDD